MLTFAKFAGINNVQPSHRLKAEELATAVNVDIGLDGELRRRAGYATVLQTCHKNLWQADGFMLATVDGNDLQAIAPNGAHTTVAESVGTSRVWYCNLPDGRVAYSNGALCGIASSTASTRWGVPVPSSIGFASDVAGALPAGEYRYLLTHVRSSDGLEGGPRFSAPLELPSGGIALIGIPTLVGHETNVYLTTANGAQRYLAGTTASSSFAFTGANEALTIPCRTEFVSPAPAGRCLAFWRGRTLLAVGNLLLASMADRWEHFNLRTDFKQFSGDITAIVPVGDGIYVGTEHELAFLAGVEFDKLAYSRRIAGAVVLGSGLQVSGELIRVGEGVGSGVACLCIADGEIVAGFGEGQVISLTAGRYRTTATEVAAVFRRINGVPQYIAVPQ